MAAEPKTEVGKQLVELAQRLDDWCEAETNITHRQARVAVGLAVVGGAALIAGWDNVWQHVIKAGDPNGLDYIGGEDLRDRSIVELVKNLVRGSHLEAKFSGLGGSRWVDLEITSEQRREALDGLLKVEGRQAAKAFTAELAFLAGIGITAAGQVLGSNEKIKGSTGVGQWAAGVIKSIGEVL